MNKFRFLKAFWSPFKRPRIYVHIGGLKIGTPYFLPSKWIGLKFIGLGWKTKWDDNDFRHEYNPVWSFVFFGFQIAVRFHAPIEHQDSYWTAWLYYELRTAKILTKAERIKQCRERFPVTYMVKQDSGYVETDYYQQILKPKYL